VKTIVLKISGELFSKKDDSFFNKDFALEFVKQIKILKEKCNIGIVIGGGNFFRWKTDGKSLNLNRSTADNVGMLATVMNGLILQDFLKKVGLESAVFNSFSLPNFTKQASHEATTDALEYGKILIFVGGTGSPFFSTDTAAVIRALQIGAKEVWKATKVDGIYNSDPEKSDSCEYIKTISYQEFIDKKFQIMDLTSIFIAKENGLKIKIFNMFGKDALIKANQDPAFGSIIS
jgi:uridylate kinase